MIVPALLLCREVSMPILVNFLHEFHPRTSISAHFVTTAGNFTAILHAEVFRAALIFSGREVNSSGDFRRGTWHPMCARRSEQKPSARCQIPLVSDHEFLDCGCMCGLMHFRWSEGSRRPPRVCLCVGASIFGGLRVRGVPRVYATVTEGSCERVRPYASALASASPWPVPSCDSDRVSVCAINVSITACICPAGLVATCPPPACAATEPSRGMWHAPPNAYVLKLLLEFRATMFGFACRSQVLRMRASVAPPLYSRVCGCRIPCPRVYPSERGNQAKTACAPVCAHASTISIRPALNSGAKHHACFSATFAQRAFSAQYSRPPRPRWNTQGPPCEARGATRRHRDTPPARQHAHTADALDEPAFGSLNGQVSGHDPVSGPFSDHGSKNH